MRDDYAPPGRWLIAALGLVLALTAAGCSDADIAPPRSGRGVLCSEALYTANAGPYGAMWALVFDADPEDLWAGSPASPGIAELRWRHDVALAQEAAWRAFDVIGEMYGSPPPDAAEFETLAQQAAAHVLEAIAAVVDAVGNFPAHPTGEAIKAEARAAGEVLTPCN